MFKKTKVSVSPEAALPPTSDIPAAINDVARPAGNASHPLEKSRVRMTAYADQVTLQEKGADALPVSDYPLKQGPVAANAVDLRQRSRKRVKRG